MTKLMIKPKKHECSVNGCRHKNCWLLNKSKERINPIWLCEEDIVDAYRQLIAEKPELAIESITNNTVNVLDAPKETAETVTDVESDEDIDVTQLDAVGEPNEAEEADEAESTDDFDAEEITGELDTPFMPKSETWADKLKRETVQPADDIPKVHDVYNANVRDTTDKIPRARYKKPTPKQAQAKGKAK